MDLMYCQGSNSFLEVDTRSSFDEDEEIIDVVGFPVSESTPSKLHPAETERCIPSQSLLLANGVFSPRGSTLSPGHFLVTSSSSSMSLDSIGSLADNNPVSPNTSVDSTDLCSQKGGRTNYTTEQVHKLQKVFSKTLYPDADTIEALAHETKVTEKKVRVWFQNKRARARRPNPIAVYMPSPFMPPTPPMSPTFVSPMVAAQYAGLQSPSEGVFNGAFLSPSPPLLGHVMTCRQPSVPMVAHQTPASYHQYFPPIQFFNPLASSRGQTPHTPLYMPGPLLFSH